MYFRVNLKMKKPTICCCFTLIVFIELRKSWDDRFAGKMEGGWEILRNWGILVMGGMILKWGRLIPFYELWPCFSRLKRCQFLCKTSSLYILSDSYNSKNVLGTRNVRYGGIFKASKRTC